MASASVASYLAHASRLLAQVAAEDAQPGGPIDRAAQLVAAAFSR
jgi:hypothetical protein